MVTKNAINSNIPIEISKGGTNSTSFVNTNGTAFYNSSNISTTATGNTGNSLAGKGTSNPIFTPISGLTLISTQTANNTAYMEFKNLAANASYTIIMSGIQPVDNAANLNMVYSVNNGSTYATTGYGGNGAFFPYNSATKSAMHSSTYIPIAESLSNSDIFSGILNLFYMANTLGFGAFGESCWNHTVSGQVFSIFGTNIQGSGVTANAVKIYMSSGNINIGTFSLYGVAS